MPVRRRPARTPGVQLPGGETEAEFKLPPEALSWTCPLPSVHFHPRRPVHGGRDRLTWAGSGGLSPAPSLDGG